MHGIAGNAGSVSLLGANLNAKLHDWEIEFDTRWWDDTGAGEGADSNVYLRMSWTGRVRGYIPNQVARYVINSGEAMLGGVGAFSVKQKSTDTQPFFSATGGYRRLRIGGNSEQGTEFECEIFCTEGVIPTVVTSPG